MAKNTKPQPSGTNVFQRVWHSIFLSPPFPQNEKDRKRFLRKNLIFHFRPLTVNEKTLLFTHSWGLGGMAAILVIIQLATGILLKFFYVPTPVDAYASVMIIITQVPFGRLIRNIHYWSANFLVVIIVLHMLRVFFTGAFHTPRQFNWVIGLFLLSLVLAANLSGYLLPYDQLAYWAVTVITAMIGYIPMIGHLLQGALGNGNELGSHILPFFFSFHTAVIPFGMILLMGFHFWRIRKANGLVVPRIPGEPVDEPVSRIPVIPHLLVKETATALVLTATVIVVSILFDAHLADPANPGHSPNPVRAPWYFAGLQELLLHLHPAMAVTLVPMVTAIFLLSIPYFPYSRSTEGIWFASTRGGAQILATTIIVMAFTFTSILIDSVVVKSVINSTNPETSGISPIIRDGILPLFLFLIFLSGWIVLMRKKWRTSLNEVVQVLFVAIVNVFVVLTIVGIFFRGSSMKLTWPL